MITQQITITGLDCSACKKITEKRINTIPGVKSVTVDLTSGIAEIVAEREISIEEVNQVFKGTDYKAVKK